MTQEFQDIDFLPAFRYGLPLQEDAIEYIMEEQKQAKNVVLFSQYPQYSCTTGGNAIRNAIRSLKAYERRLEVSVIDQWHDHPSYIQALSAILERDIKHLDLDKTIVLFTAHSLPASNIWEGDMYPYYIYHTCQLLQHSLKQRGLPIDFYLGYQSKVGLQ